MKNVRCGFILVEIMISLTIISMMLVILYQMISL
ncbi:MAG: prepilin-type N-terminal cleavage/methylation domain-containing protein [Erysipelothrix sp.]|nr:prepilin-type N-terminal cleavage/methylation domain-containing protein [Erysipelothrix sp.]